MATVVSTGQITIVDANDAKPIYASISTNGMGAQQIIKKVDGGLYKYAPVDWSKTTPVATPLILTWTVYAGDVDATQYITNVIWKKTGNITADGAYNPSIGGTTYTYSLGAPAPNSAPNVTDKPNGAYKDPANSMRVYVDKNLTEIVPSLTFQVTGDYTDADTGIVTRLSSEIQLTGVMAGSSATYLQVNGSDKLISSNTPAQNIAVLWADLVNTDNGVDDTDVSYAWYKAPFGTADLIGYNIANPTITPGDNYGFISTNKLAEIRDKDPNPGDDVSVVINAARLKYVLISTAIPPGMAADTATRLTLANAPSAYTTNLKALVVGANAVNSLGSYKVIARDNSTGTTYETYFSVKDLTDPYSVEISSTAGAVFRNGVGVSTLTPTVFNGSKKLTNLTDWFFKWSIATKEGANSLLSLQANFKSVTVESVTVESATANTLKTGALIYLSNISYYKLTTAYNVSYILKALSGITTNNNFYMTVTTSAFSVDTSPSSVDTVAFPAVGDLTKINGLVGATLSRCANSFYVTAPSITVRDEDIVSKGVISVEAVRP